MDGTIVMFSVIVLGSYLLIFRMHCIVKTPLMV